MENNLIDFGGVYSNFTFEDIGTIDDYLNYIRFLIKEKLNYKNPSFFYRGDEIGKQEFEQFNPNSIFKLGAGVYLTKNFDYSKKYAEDKKGKVYVVLLDFSNVKVFDDKYDYYLAVNEYNHPDILKKDRVAPRQHEINKYNDEQVFNKYDYLYVKKTGAADELVAKNGSKFYILNSDNDKKGFEEFMKTKTLNENKLKGGKADKLTIKDIAKNFDVSVKDVKSQIKKGKKVESEHTSDEEKQNEIAMDHVSEFPDYYDRIDKMEKAAKKYWGEKKKTNESKLLVKKLLREELENLNEGRFANLAAGVGLAAGSLFGGKDAMAQDKFKDKIENLGDKFNKLKTGAGEELAQLKTVAGDKLNQFKDDLKQTVSSVKDKTELKNIGSRNYSFAEIKKGFEEESKKGNVQYGVGESQDHGFSWEKAFADAADKYMQKKGLNTLEIGQVLIKQHTFQKQDGTYVTIALFKFENR